MREDDSNWFSKWEEQLPSPDELISISQTLITPDLAMAFDIRHLGSAGNHPISLLHHQQQPSPQLLHHHHHHQQSSSAPPPPHPNHNSSEFDSSSAELGGGGGGGGGGGVGSGSGGAASEEPARTLKRPRLVWTPQLHKRFVDAVAHLGIKNAVPKTIMQLMSVDGLTRENVASHLQKYRLYLKRMQGLNNGCGPATGGGGGGGGGSGGSGDPATDHLFASSPVPAHFLHQAGTGVGVGGGGGGGYVPVAALHHQQMAVAAHPQIQVQYPHHRQMGVGVGVGHFDQHTFLTRQGQTQLGTNRIGMMQNSGYVEDVESGTANGRKVLTLFPTGDD